jgi:high-affinity iron transporter
MLPTFVIGLREGLEAALIVGIIAAFLRKQGRDELLRWVFAGIACAVALCLAVGIALDVLSRDLPQKQQEGLETVIGALAVGMVSYMVIWMRRHSRELKGALEGAAASAMDASGGQKAGRALVVMAFLAVLREGFETVVFLLAAFNEAGSGTGPVAGAITGIAVALVLGYGIYRGGVRLNLSKFFRATGLVLVLVAAGLVMTAFHTAHEAGWLNAGQGLTFDISWLVRPGSVRASLLTGILGLQPRPVVIELVGWLVYLVPVAAYVAWPAGRKIAPRRVAVGATALAGLAAVAAGALVLASPGKPAGHPSPVGLARAGTAVVDGMQVDRYRRTTTTPAAPGRFAPALTDVEVARLNGGRLPLGLSASSTKVPVSYSSQAITTVDVAPGTHRVIARRSSERITATAHLPVGAVPLPRPVSSTTHGWPGDRVSAAVAAARDDIAALDRRSDLRQGAASLAVVAGLFLVAGAAAGLASRRSRTVAAATPVDGAANPLIEREVSLT